MQAAVIKQYRYHFDTNNSGWTSHLTCGELAHALKKKALAIAQTRAVLHNCEDKKEIPATSPAIVPAPFTPTEQTLMEEWKEIRKLQWKYLSEEKMERDTVDARLDHRVKLAIHRILDYVCPALELTEISHNAVIQLIALGNEILVAASKDREFFRVVEDEMQDIDMGAMLRKK